jgi:hypothetical protein
MTRDRGAGAGTLLRNASRMCLAIFRGQRLGIATTAPHFVSLMRATVATNRQIRGSNSIGSAKKILISLLSQPHSVRNFAEPNLANPPGVATFATGDNGAASYLLVLAAALSAASFASRNDLNRAVFSRTARACAS